MSNVATKTKDLNLIAACKAVTNFDGSNPLRWEDTKIPFLSVITAFGMLAVLLGDEENEQRDLILFAALMQCLSGQALKIASNVTKKVGSVAYARMCEVFEQPRLVTSNRRALRRKLNRMKLERGKNMRDYITQAELDLSELIAAGGKMTDDDFSENLLAGVPDDLLPALASINLRDDLTLQETKSALLKAWDVVYGNQEQNKDQPTTEDKVWHTRGGKQGGSNAPCSHCGRRSHHVNKCWHKYPNLRPGRSTDDKPQAHHTDQPASSEQAPGTVPPGFCFLTGA